VLSTWPRATGELLTELLYFGVITSVLSTAHLRNRGTAEPRCVTHVEFKLGLVSMSVQMTW